MPYEEKLLSYVAGIIDGEGSILYCKSIRNRKGNINPAYGVRISISMCDKEIPELFQKNFGGSIYIRKSTNKKYKTVNDVSKM